MSRIVPLLAVACFAASAHADTRYFSAMEDLPLAPGLSEAGPGLWFDDPNGRITGAMAHGSVAPEAVRRFYLDTLPALGWALSPGAGVDGELVFLRGRERLALAITARNGGAELEARLFVRPASMRGD